MGIRVQVSCVAVRDNQIALIRRLDDQDPALFLKLLPPGGHVEHGETLEEACKREMWEETGLSVDKLELRGVVSFISRTADEYHSVCFFFVAGEVFGEFTQNNPDEQEKLEAVWVNLDDVSSHPDVSDYHQAIIRHVLDERGFMNALVEWFPPDGELIWHIETSGETIEALVK